MATKLIKSDYKDFSLSFTEDGWFNATEAAEKFGKEIFDWIRQRDTVEYVSALAEMEKSISGFLPEFSKISELDGTSGASRAKLLRLVKSTGLVKTKSGPAAVGGGTWLHPKLAVLFARWLDVRFAIWCDSQIDNIVRGRHPHIDWRRMRHEASNSFKVMAGVIQLTRESQGKACAPHHFSNEARLINWALTGSFDNVDRESLAYSELDLLAKLEERNAVMLGAGWSYDERKESLALFTAKWRTRKLAA